MGVLGEFKRGVDVAHGDWFGVREGTHLLGVHPLHPKSTKTFLIMRYILSVMDFLERSFGREVLVSILRRRLKSH
ncbi:hypothetical protein Hanom_Chr11g01046931 [Helianthus anomalus]